MERQKTKIIHVEGHQHEKEFTCGVGDRGAASTGKTELALVANLYNATEPSHCSFTLPDSRSPNNKSNPVWHIFRNKPLRNSVLNEYNHYKITSSGRSRGFTIFINKNYFSIIRSTKISESQSNSSLNIPFGNPHQI